jgi:hypothetical protein
MRFSINCQMPVSGMTGIFRGSYRVSWRASMPQVLRWLVWDQRDYRPRITGAGVDSSVRQGVQVGEGGVRGGSLSSRCARNPRAGAVRPTGGLARYPYDRVHSHDTYDLEVDTSTMYVDEAYWRSVSM